MIRTALLAAFLAAASAAHAQEADPHAGHGAPAAATAAAGAATERYRAAMERMHAATVETTGDPAGDFARMMIPHHESAVEMARAYLESGDTDPVLTRFANEVVRSQESEIGELRAWLAANGR